MNDQQKRNYYYHAALPAARVELHDPRLSVAAGATDGADQAGGSSSAGTCDEAGGAGGSCSVGDSENSSCLRIGAGCVPSSPGASSSGSSSRVATVSGAVFCGVVTQLGGVAARNPPSPAIEATAPSVTTTNSRRWETRRAFFAPLSLGSLLRERPVSRSWRRGFWSFGCSFNGLASPFWRG